VLAGIVAAGLLLAGGGALLLVEQDMREDDVFRWSKHGVHQRLD
jgi:hypothetical protein